MPNLPQPNWLMQFRRRYLDWKNGRIGRDAKCEPNKHEQVEVKQVLRPKNSLRSLLQCRMPNSKYVCWLIEMFANIYSTVHDFVDIWYLLSLEVCVRHQDVYNCLIVAFCRFEYRTANKPKNSRIPDNAAFNSLDAASGLKSSSVWPMTVGRTSSLTLWYILWYWSGIAKRRALAFRSFSLEVDFCRWY